MVLGGVGLEEGVVERKRMRILSKKLTEAEAAKAELEAPKE